MRRRGERLSNFACPMAFAIASATSVYHSRPNGNASEMRWRPRLRPADELRKRAYHFLRNAAANFSIIHRSPTQISHSTIRTPTTTSRSPMSLQKDLPPPGIYDGACAIVKRNASPCIWKPLSLISAEERHQQTYALKRFETILAACYAPKSGN
jgi:hypothetical protein